MRGLSGRSNYPGPNGGRPATVLVLVMILALIAGCASPAPTASAIASQHPTDGPSAPSATPGTVPDPSDAPVAGGWERGVELPPLEPVATFEALEAGAAGVVPDTAFRLTALDGSDPVALARRLVAEPAVELAVAAADGAAIVTPAQPLSEGGSYRFTLRATDGTLRGAWAVQAVAPLAVAQSTPEDTSTRIPVDTGIELTFNQAGVAASDVERFLTIRPAVAGRVEIAGRVAAFIPDEPLAPSTLYTITLRSGLPLAGTPMTLERDLVIRFETIGRSTPALRIRPLATLVETAPAERAVVTVVVDPNGDEEEETADFIVREPVVVEAHRLPDLEAAVVAWRRIEAAPEWSTFGGAPVDTSALPRVLEAKVRLHRFNDYDWEQYLRLPGRLDAGWYVVTITGDATPAQVVLQVTDLALYAVVTTTRSLAWVNDLGTGAPVRGASVTVDGVALGRTGIDGVAEGRTPRRALAPEPTTIDGSDAFGTADAPLVVVRDGLRAVFAAAGDGLCGKCDGANPTTPWWIVFGPDRYTYRSTDTINAWGVLRDRATGDVPAMVEVTLDAWSESRGGATPVARVTADPDRNGAFLVSIPTADLPYGEYELTLRLDGEALTARAITVDRILKPAWTLAVTTAHRAAVAGSSVDVTAQATFYEGTPVAGVAIVAGADERSTTLRTNSVGTATGSVRVGLDSEGYQWDVVSVVGRPKLPEEGEISGSAPIAIFRAGVIVKASPVIANGRLRVTGSVHTVAFGRFDDPSVTWLGDVDPYGRPRAGIEVRVKVVEHRSVRRKVGTVYDWITKRVVPRYEYDDVTADRGTHTVRTDADGRFRLGLDAVKGRDYELSVSAADDAGRTTALETWADAVGVRESMDTEPRIVGDDREDGWSVGERVRLSFRGGPGAGASATYLWTTAHAGLRSWTVTSRPRYTDTFRAADVPGFVVNAVRFTGTGYVVAPYERSVDFRIEDRRLAVTVTPDKARYAPGDRATVTVRTTDEAGRAVPTSVYLAVIDEKLVSMGIVDDMDPLATLYESLSSGILGRAWSHRVPTPGGGGEGGDTTGGGGGDEARSDFRDWLVGRIVRTGADGRATVSFDLSDDLTSWHAFASGVSPSLMAGRGDALLPVSLPFFAELTVADSYLVADRPIVRVRAYGEGLAAGDTVTFVVSSDTLPMAPVTVTAPAFRAAEVPLPTLAAGTQRLRVEATVGSGDAARHDALVRAFSVLDGHALQATVTRAVLDGPMPVAAGEGLTTLLLADAGRGRVVPLLDELASGDPVRGDRALAAAVAVRVLRDVFGLEPEGSALDLDLDGFLGESGYAVLPYAGGTVELTALAALSGDARLGDLSRYLTFQSVTTREEQIWVLATLAASGSPALADIREVATQSDLTVNERVALAIAALAAGDEVLAGRLERDLLREHGERRGPWVRLAAGTDDDDTAVLTARLAIVAASLGDMVAADMDAYLEANPPRTTLIVLERALAARGWALRMPAADASARLTVDGTTSVLRIEASRPVRVVLTPGQAAGASLAPGSGSVVVTTSTERPLDAASLAAPSWLTPTRTVEPASSIGVADTVVVELQMEAPERVSEGCWVVTEWVPSGLVPVTGAGWVEEDEEGKPAGSGTAPWRVHGQRLDFCLSREGAEDHEVLRYVARVVTPGTYRWEPAVIQSPLEPGVGAVIPASTITIVGER